VTPPARQAGSWEHVADWYEALAGAGGTEFHQQVIIPGLLRLLQLKPGEKVCDLACGQGAVTTALAGTGAQVTGVDLSPRLIELARKRSPKSVRYVIADARNVSALQCGTFDAVTCVLAAMNIDPVGPLFAEMARLLRPQSPLPPGEGQSLPRTGSGGEGHNSHVEGPDGQARIGHRRGSGQPLARAVVVILHPAFRIPRQSRWKWDEGRKLLIRETDRYLGPLKVPIDMRPFNRPGESLTATYHRPIQTYVNGLTSNGLWVSALEEWPSHRKSQPGPRAKAEDRARDEFPLFMAIRATKVMP